MPPVRQEMRRGARALGYAVAAASSCVDLPDRFNLITQETAMPVIKLHLEQAEHDAIARFASAMHVKPEAILYSALNRLMLDPAKAQLLAEITETWEAHRDNLPLWSDSACSIHAYEGKPDAEPHPSRYA
jgi:hypothetical protein